MSNSVGLMWAAACAALVMACTDDTPRAVVAAPLTMGPGDALAYFVGSWECTGESAFGGYSFSSVYRFDGAREVTDYVGTSGPLLDGIGAGDVRTTPAGHHLSREESFVYQTGPGTTEEWIQQYALDTTGWQTSGGTYRLTWEGTVASTLWPSSIPGPAEPALATITFESCDTFISDWRLDSMLCTRVTPAGPDACRAMSPPPGGGTPPDDASTDDARTDDAAIDGGAPPEEVPDAGDDPLVEPEPSPGSDGPVAGDWSVPPTGCMAPGLTGGTATPICPPTGWDQPIEDDPCDWSCWGGGHGYVPCARAGGGQGWRFCWRYHFEPITHGRWGACESAPPGTPTGGC